MLVVGFLKLYLFCQYRVAEMCTCINNVGTQQKRSSYAIQTLNCAYIKANANGKSNVSSVTLIHFPYKKDLNHLKDIVYYQQQRNI